VAGALAQRDGAAITEYEGTTQKTNAIKPGLKANTVVVDLLDELGGEAKASEAARKKWQAEDNLRRYGIVNPSQLTKDMRDMPGSNPFVTPYFGMGPTAGQWQPTEADQSWLTGAMGALGTVNAPFEYQSAVYHGQAPGLTQNIRQSAAITKGMTREQAQAQVAENVRQRSLSAGEAFMDAIQKYREADIPFWSRLAGESTNPIFFVPVAQVAEGLGLGARAIKAGLTIDNAMATVGTLGMNKALEALVARGLQPLAKKVATRAALSAAEKAKVTEALEGIAAETTGAPEAIDTIGRQRAALAVEEAAKETPTPVLEPKVPEARAAPPKPPPGRPAKAALVPTPEVKPPVVETAMTEPIAPVSATMVTDERLVKAWNGNRFTEFEKRRMAEEAKLKAPARVGKNKHWWMLTENERVQLEPVLRKEVSPAAKPSVAEAPKAAPKEPWQMTRTDFINQEVAGNYAQLEREKGAKASALSLGKYAPGTRAEQESKTWFSLSHEHSVARALSEGKPVPPEVLKDYPDLAAKVAPAQAATPPAATVPWKLMSTNDQANAFGLSQKVAQHAEYPQLKKLVDTRYSRAIGEKRTYAPDDEQYRYLVAGPGTTRSSAIAELQNKIARDVGIGLRRDVGLFKSVTLDIPQPKTELTKPLPGQMTLGPGGRAAIVGASAIPAAVEQTQEPDKTQVSALWWLPAIAAGAVGSAVALRRLPTAARAARTAIAESGFKSLDRITQLAAASVERDRPGTITGTLLKVPGLKKVLTFERPGLAMTGKNEKVLVGMVAETAARSDVNARLLGSRVKAINGLRDAFGEKALHGEKVPVRFRGTTADASPIDGTLLDIAQRPQLYDLTPQQARALDLLQSHNDSGLRLVTEGYGADIGRYPVATGGAYLPNVDVDKPILDQLGSETRAVATGRSKTRFYASAADRMAADATFKPETDVQRLIEGADSFKASAAGGETLRHTLGGKTRLEVMQETHPELYSKMTALKSRLGKLRGSLGTLDRKLDTAVSDFIKSPTEPEDFNALRDAFDVSLASGPRAGMGAAEIEREIAGVKRQIAALRPAWEVANPKPYVMVQQGIFRYFPVDTANLINQTRQVTNNRLLNFVESWRGQAFSGDFSPFAIQDALGVLADPIGSAKTARGAITKARVAGDPFRSMKVSALAEDVAADPDGWAEYAALMGRRLAGTPEEFSAGFLTKIPKFSKFNEATYVTVTRGSKALYDRTWKSLASSGLPELEAKVVAAHTASEIYPLVNVSRLGQSQARAAVLRALPTSYSFIRQPANMMLDAGKGIWKLAIRQPLTQSEKVSVRLMTTMAASVLAASAASAAATAAVRGQDVLKAMKDAVNPDPNNGKFASIIVGDIRIPIGGPYRALFRAMTPKEVPGIPIAVPMAGIPQFVMNRISPALRTQLDLIKNKDYYGNQILKGDFPEQVMRGLAYEAEGAMPLTVGAGVESIRTGGEGGSPLQQMLGQFAGVNVIEATPAQRRDGLRDIIARQQGKQSWWELSGDKRKELTESNADLKKATEDAAAKWAATTTPEAMLSNQVTKDLDEAYTTYSEGITKAAELAEMAARENDQYAYVNFKDAVKTWGTFLGIRRDQIENNPEYKTVIDKWAQLSKQKKDDLQRDGLQEAAEDVAYEQYQAIKNDPSFEINDAQYGDTFDFDSYQVALETFRNQWGDQMFQYVKERAASNKEELPQAYFDYQRAKEALRPYWDLDKKAKAAGPPDLDRQIKAYDTLSFTTPTDKMGSLRMMFPAVAAYRKLLDMMQMSWRELHPDGDALLTKYYHRKPIALQVTR